MTQLLSFVCHQVDTMGKKHMEVGASQSNESLCVTSPLVKSPDAEVEGETSPVREPRRHVLSETVINMANSCGAIGGSLAITTSTGGGQVVTDHDEVGSSLDGEGAGVESRFWNGEAEATLSLLQVDDNYDAEMMLDHHSRAVGGTGGVMMMNAGIAGGCTSRSLGGSKKVAVYRHYAEQSGDDEEYVASSAATDALLHHCERSRKKSSSPHGAPAAAEPYSPTAAGPTVSSVMGVVGWRDDEEEAEARERLEKILRDQQRSREEELMELHRVYTKAVRKNFRSLRGMPEPNFDAPSALYEEELDAIEAEQLQQQQEAQDQDESARSPSHYTDCTDEQAVARSAVDVMLKSAAPPLQPAASSSSSSRHRMQGLVYPPSSASETTAAGATLDGTHIHTTHGGGTRGMGGVVPRGFVNRMRRCRLDEDDGIEGAGGSSTHYMHDATPYEEEEEE